MQKHVMKRPNVLMSEKAMKKIQDKKTTINGGKFIPRGSMSPVIAGVTRSVHVQVYTNRPFSTGTKAYKDTGHSQV